MDVSDSCNALLKTAACLVRVIGNDKPMALLRIAELKTNLNGLEDYVKESIDGTQKSGS